MPNIPPEVLARRPNYQPSPPINRTYSGPAVPTVYDQNWQRYNNLTPAQAAWFQSCPEWQNFLMWAALSPTTATIHADGPPPDVMVATLLAAGKTPMPITPKPVIAI